MRKIFFLLIGFLCFFFVSEAQPSQAPMSCPFTHEALHSPWVDSVYLSLSPRQRVAQLFMPAIYPRNGEAHFAEVDRWVENNGFGGLIFFQGGPKTVARLTNRFQAKAGVPLLMSVDAEWGLGMRLDSVLLYPRQMMLGAVTDESLIYEMGRNIALDCRRIGLHINFAPCVDINNNALNPVINNRSFGEDKELVATLSEQYFLGMSSERLLSTAKHFPGHGDTHTDSHVSLPVLDHSYERLDSLELFPYKELIANGLNGVMAGHLFIPALDDTPNLASSLSPRVLRDLLRDTLGFNGLIYTDALNMGGVASHFEPGALEVQALKAGVDVLLMPSNPVLSLQKVMEALEAGVLSWADVEMSCRRILAAKQWAGLDHYAPVHLEGIDAYLNRSVADMTRRRIIEAGITLVQNQNDLLPLRNLGTTKVAVLLQNISAPNEFLRTLQLYQEHDVYYAPPGITEAALNSLLDVLRKYDVVIAGVHDTNYRPAQQYGITPEIIYLSDRLASSTRTILCLFGIPYALNYFQNLEEYAGIVVGYQDQVLIQNYTAQIIYGAIGARGILPVTPVPDFKAGSGIFTLTGLRLKYSVPAEVGADELLLARVDSLVLGSISDRVMPGCQVLAAKDGVVFYHKAFGQNIYGEEGRPVATDDIYDLASITKMLGTTQALMWLRDRNRVRPRDKVSVVLPQLRSTDKEQLTFAEMLTHQAGLFPFFDFVPSLEKKNLFRSVSDAQHQIQVADSLFVPTHIHEILIDSIVRSKLLPKKEYRYSDLGFYLMKEAAESMLGQSLPEFLTERFFRPLGATTLGYLPLARFPKERIMPTEKDTLFRKQWLQGYVHDPGAALLGGVGGHAGLFAAANDVAKMMQMMLNGGVYGGEVYLSRRTLNEFTSAPFSRSENRRGLGFDRPQDPPEPEGPTAESVSQKSFGHNGFTGTYAWVDPESGVLYVFLSNRVSPDASNNLLSKRNIRTYVHQLILESLGYFPPKK